MKKVPVFIIVGVMIGSAAGISVYAQGVQPAVSSSQPVMTPQAAAQQTVTPAQAPEPEPVLEIKASEKDPALFSIELKNAEINDIFRVLAYKYGLNILVDGKVSGEVTASFTAISLEEALSAIAEINHLCLEKKGRVIVVSPNLITRTFVLQYINAAELLDQGGAGTGSSAASMGTGAAAGTVAGAAAGAQGAVSAGTSGQAVSAGSGSSASSPHSIYGLLSEDGKILSGTQTNSIMVIDYPRYVEKIAEYIESVDRKLNTKVFNLQYISVKDLFSDLIDDERSEREKQREERKAERDEIKEIREKADDSDSGD